MKKVILFSVALLLSTGALFAQKSKVMSAFSALQNYNNYGNEVSDLEKAKASIDEAMDTYSGMDLAAVKAKDLAKAYNYQALIYTALLKVEDNPALSEGAGGVALNAIKKTIEFDEKGKYKKPLVDALFFDLGPNSFRQGYGLLQDKKYDKAYEVFQQAIAMNKMVQENKDILDKVRMKLYASQLNVPEENLDGMVIDTTLIFATAIAASNLEGKRDESKDLYQQLLDLSYDSPDIYQTLANLYREDGEMDKANATLKQGRERFPDNKDLVISEINVLLQEGDPEAVITKIKEGIALEPNNPSLYLVLAGTYEKLDKQDEALENYEQAVKVDPEFEAAHYNAGVIHYNRGANSVKEATALPLSKDKEYNALLAEAKTHFNKARPFFEKYVSIKPKDKDALKVLKTIYENLEEMDKVKEIKATLDALGG